MDKKEMKQEMPLCGQTFRLNWKNTHLRVLTTSSTISSLLPRTGSAPPQWVARGGRPLNVGPRTRSISSFCCWSWSWRVLLPLVARQAAVKRGSAHPLHQLVQRRGQLALRRRARQLQRAARGREPLGRDILQRLAAEAERGDRRIAARQSHVQVQLAE